MSLLGSIFKGAVKAVKTVVNSPAGNVIGTVAKANPWVSGALAIGKTVAKYAGIGGAVTAASSYFNTAQAATGGGKVGMLGKVVKYGGAALTGATLAGGGSAPRRRRRRKRLTNSEITELMQLKMLFGARSPVVTIAGLKMLNRGG